MEAKVFIRQYEGLKNEKTGTLQEKIRVENSWLKLYKDMMYVKKKLSRKQKEQLNPFIEKSLKELKNISSELFHVVTKEKKGQFNQLLQKNESLFFRKGTKGLIELVLQQKQPGVTYQTRINEMSKKERLLQITSEEWMASAQELFDKECRNLTEAYEMEQELIKLFGWWEEKKKTVNENQDLLRLYSQLCNCSVKISNYILQELGYSVQIDDYIQQKEYKKMLRKKGLLFTIQAIEEKQDGNSLLIKEILDKIAFIHPRNEFKSVRRLKRHFILHIGPTNSGKTYRAIEKLKQSASGVYLAPIRLLAYEVYEKMNESRIPCNLLTGDEELRMLHARHQSSTVEMTPFNQEMEVAVIDEAQMIENPERGNAWLRAIFGLQAKEIHVCGAQHAVPFIVKLIQECGDTYEIHGYERQTPLHVEEEEFTFPSSVRKGDALIVFSKNRVLHVTKELQEAGYNVSTLYGKLPPNARKKQVELFSTGETDVIVSTDAIGIGLNLPIQRVVFLETKKYDGTEERPLTIQEVKQIAGRAGRKGRYEQGYVNAIDRKEEIKEKLDQREEPIQKSVVVPTMKLAEIEIGTLKHRLIAWTKAHLNSDYLEKADVQKSLSLLTHVEKWEHIMGAETLFKTLSVPFDMNTKELLTLWIQYVNELKDQKKRLTKPRFLGNSLKELELYYHQLNMHYSFSRKFKLSMDKTWVNEEKNRVTGMMNRQMNQGIYKRAI